MRERIRAGVAVMLVLACALLAVGCVAQSDETATFVRYETLEDGTQVAVVQPTAVGASGPYRALTTITDLKAGEYVTVRYIGRNWDTAQWVPDREIVKRGGAQ